MWLRTMTGCQQRMIEIQAEKTTMQLMYFRHKLRGGGVGVGVRVRVRVRGGAAAGRSPETLPSRTELVPELSTPVLHRITLRLPQDEVRIGQELLRDQHQHTRAVRVPCPQHLPHLRGGHMSASPAPEGGGTCQRLPHLRGGGHMSASPAPEEGGGAHVSISRT